MKKILIIDDEEVMCNLLEFFLKDKYEVITCHSGRSALSALEESIPDLIISDIQMPEMTGFEFLEEVRVRGFTKHVPVIMLSASEESAERIKSYRLGAQDYLVKPFNPEELDELIKKNLYPIHFASIW